MMKGSELGRMTKIDTDWKNNIWAYGFFYRRVFEVSNSS